MIKTKQEMIQASEKFKSSYHQKLAETLKNVANAADQAEYQRAWRAYWQNYMDELDKRGMIKNDHGQDVPLWEKVLQEAHKAIHSEQHVYNDWRSAMMSLLSMFSSLVDAISHSIAKTIAETAKTIAETDIAQRISNKAVVAYKGLVGAVADRIRGKMNVELGPLDYNIKMGDEGTLGVSLNANSSNLKSMDKASFATLDKQFQILVDCWLAEKGEYVPATTPGMYVSLKDNKTLLTKEAFDQLNQGENSLDAYLKKVTDLDFSYKSPTP